jgi:hypothetical protein
MNKNKTLEDIKVNVKIKLSALWVTLMSLYIYADFFALHNPGGIEKIIKGFLGPFAITQQSLLMASVLMIIPGIMIFFSLVLKAKVSRYTNIIIGILYTLVNIGNLIGESFIYYILFGVIEMIITLLIVFYAWKWPKN